MEDVLAVYTRPRDPERPLVCLDETSKQLVVEIRVPMPTKPGRPARFDYEYERNGHRQPVHDARATRGALPPSADRARPRNIRALARWHRGR
jgi:hypothetical protein